MYQKEIDELPLLSDYRYENFFNVYKDNSGYYYNLLRNIDIVSSNNSSLEDIYAVEPQDTWAYISYKHYGGIELWWLICIYNQIMDASKMPEPGTLLRLLKPKYVGYVLEQLKTQINL